ncbi:hypothetical protein EBV26_20255 [bacterium]|nr:hypothetical protein [bacterium]
MSDRQELYTDYALQLFVTYINRDADGMHSVLKSFSDDDEHDEFFMPGLIYGLLYHFSTVTNAFCEQTGANIEDVLTNYAIDYAIEREDLLENPLLNVKYAKKNVEEIKELLRRMEEEGL